MLALISHSRANAGRELAVAHDEEGTGKKISRQSRERAGSVRLKPVWDRCLAEFINGISASQDISCNATSKTS